MWLFLAGWAGWAQGIDLGAQRMHVTSLAELPWRFHPGDAPGWAAPGLDDRGWRTLVPGKPWAPQGYTEQNGMAWFRVQLLPEPGTSQLVLQMPTFQRSYQLFSDGTLVGQVGGLPPNQRSVVPAPRLWTLPVRAPGQPVTVALRMWEDPGVEQIRASGRFSQVLAGQPAPMLQQFAQQKAAALLGSASDYGQDLVILVAGVAALVMAFSTRQPLFLWAALNSMVSVSQLPFRLAARHAAWNFYSNVLQSTLVDYLAGVSLVMFVVRLLGLRSRWAWAVPILLITVADVSILMFSAHLWSVNTVDFVYAWTVLFGQGMLVVYLVFAAGKRVDARILLVALLPTFLQSMMANIGHWLVDLHVSWAENIITVYTPVITQPFVITRSDVLNIWFSFGVLGVLVYHFVEREREEQRLASALLAAQQAQRKLLPEHMPELGGLRSQVVYLAAEEVGGDFCQLLPCADGALLVVIGDVSGKGLEAAMQGTLLVGALRALAGEPLGPAEVLQRLNGVALRAGHSGFSTCLCMLISPAGELRAANAGHLAPYLNGVELEVESGLPLGLVPDAEYAERRFRLPAQARLTLLSDGVVEARSRSGELFGFARTGDVSGRGAQEIADLAKRYGQTDDITVVTLDWREPMAAATELVPA
jgi:hypothetical protein